MVQAEYYLEDVPTPSQIEGMNPYDQLRLFGDTMRDIFEFNETPEELMAGEVGSSIYSSKMRLGHVTEEDTVYFKQKGIVRSGMVNIVARGPMTVVLSDSISMLGQTFTVVSSKENPDNLVAFLDPQ